MLTTIIATMDASEGAASAKACTAHNGVKLDQPMAIGDHTVLEFTFGTKTVQGTGFGTNNAITAGNTAYFDAVGGIVFGPVGGVHFAYSSAGQTSNIDASNSGQINVAGTDVLHLAPGHVSHSFSNATLNIGIAFGTYAVSFSNSTGAVLAAFDSGDFGHSDILQYAGKFNQIKFTASILMTVNSLAITVNCFAPDTEILTPTGPRPVQDLRAGDPIVTDEDNVVEIVQIGTQSVFPRFQHPALINLICITKGALGGGLPFQNLYVSGDHGIEISDVIYNASALVNGTTIFQTTNWPFADETYYHIETKEHSLILAQGVSAETFVDYAGRDGFVVSGTDQNIITEMPLPRVSSARNVPIALTKFLAKIALIA